MRFRGNWVSGGSTTVAVSGAAFALLLIAGGASQARADVPVCYDNNQQPLAMNDQQVLAWKQSEPNAWKGRGNIDGTVIAVEPDATGHNHFIVQIGPNAQTDIIEVIYSYEFGALPAVTVGMEIQACGDFIQSYAPTGPYPASPAGAIIHWLHVDPARRHPDGFVYINGVDYGTNTSNDTGYPQYNN